MYFSICSSFGLKIANYEIVIRIVCLKEVDAACFELTDCHKRKYLDDLDICTQSVYQ